jgi:tetratricopeptide (TPR) repeat protein
LSVSAVAVAMWVILSTSTLTEENQSVPSRANVPAPIPDRGALLKQAAEAQQAGRLEEAIRLLRIAAERHKSVRAYLELARVQSRTKDAAGAFSSLSKARELAPNAEDVLSAYSQLALALKQPMAAVLALQSLTRICPSVSQYHYLLGVGLMAIGDMPSAQDALMEANRLEPDRAVTLLALGLALNNRKGFAEARTALSRSLELQPDSPEAIAALAEADAGLGDFDSAATHATRALEQAPTSATAHLVMGLVLMERRNYTGARDALLKATAADPGSAKVVYQLSLVYARLGDDANARRYVTLYQETLRGVGERIKALRAGGSLSAGQVRQ